MDERNVQQREEALRRRALEREQLEQIRMELENNLRVKKEEILQKGLSVKCSYHLDLRTGV